MGNSLDTKRIEEAPVTDAPVNFVEDVLLRWNCSIFQCLKTIFEYWVADWAAAITKAKKEVWKPKVTKTLKNDRDIDNKILVCYPHVQRNIQKKLKSIAEFEKEILNIQHIQLSETRD